MCSFQRMVPPLGGGGSGGSGADVRNQRLASGAGIFDIRIILTTRGKWRWHSYSYSYYLYHSYKSYKVVSIYRPGSRDTSVSRSRCTCQ
jgi:hypothetical protein